MAFRHVADVRIATMNSCVVPGGTRIKSRNAVKPPPPSEKPSEDASLSISVNGADVREAVHIEDKGHPKVRRPVASDDAVIYV